MTVFSCNIGFLQNGEAPAKERTSPFSKIDFKKGNIYVSVDNQEYKWLKLDTIAVSEIVDLFKENYHHKWQQRFSEDLVEHLNELDIYPKQKESFTLEGKKGEVKTILLKFDKSLSKNVNVSLFPFT